MSAFRIFILSLPTIIPSLIVSEDSSATLLFSGPGVSLFTLILLWIFMFCTTYTTPISEDDNEFEEEDVDILDEGDGGEPD